MKAHALAIVATLALVAPLPSNAADLAVSYTVQEKPLKDAGAGTPFTFSLYSDNGCTALVHMATVNSEDVDFISRLLLFRPKNDVKQPKTVELRHTLRGVTPASVHYLRVTGSGVVASGATCQAQAAAVAGPPGAPGIQGPPGPRGPSGPGAVVKDASGAVIGPWGPDGLAWMQGVMVTASNGRVGILGVLTTEFYGTSNVYWESGDCTGPALMQADDNPVPLNSALVNGTAYFPAVSASTRTLHSYRTTTGPCKAVSFSGQFSVAETLDVSGFIPPFHVELQ